MSEVLRCFASERANQARALYMQYRNEMVDAMRSGETLILQDLATLRFST
jgi:hypothetical protein